jgi:LPXTG-motif cell wall-anchored protein
LVSAAIFSSIEEDFRYRDTVQFYITLYNKRREESMWWFVIMILGIIVFALFIDWRRKKNNNNNHTRGINPSTKSGESSNYQSGEGRDW